MTDNPKQDSKSDYFAGETMTCIMSGRTHTSSPDVESDWDCIVLDEKSYYVSKEWRESGYRNWGYKETWLRILKKIETLHPTPIDWNQVSTEFREHRKGKS